MDSSNKKTNKNTRRRPGRDSEEAIAKAERLVAEAEMHASQDEKLVPGEDFAPPNEHSSESTEGLIDLDPEGAHEMKDHAAEEETETGVKESPFKSIHVNILGKDLLTIETPDRVVEIADSVVEQWKADGDFTKIPVGHPLAQALAAKGLRKAKDIEKKLEEKGVFAMAQMGLSILKSKLKK